MFRESSRSHQPAFRTPLIGTALGSLIGPLATTLLVVSMSACSGSRSLSNDARGWSRAERTTKAPSVGWGHSPAIATRNRETEPSETATESADPPSTILSANAIVWSDGSQDESSAACESMLDETEPLYALPYAVGEAYAIPQATCSPYTHRGAFAFSYDFEMPRGTPVIAARDGVVTSVLSSRPENTNRSADANYVMIRHDDGEHSRYLHLMQNGVVVSEGDVVKAGDLIAYSGNSGRSSRPHTHFDVTGGCGRVSDQCPTLPATFINSDDKAPVAGKVYLALRY